MKNDPDMRWNKWLTICVYGNAIVVAIVALYFFLIPFGVLVLDIRDPALHTGEMPHFVYRWHQELSGRYETWARDRVASGEAAEVSVQDISGTEWPVFSSVYYLWATEALQDAWEEDPTLAKTRPSEYAQGAIEAAAALIVDPNHATWVKKHWGDNYLYRENIFYRMLYISGLTSYQKLLGDDRYQELLLSQIDTLSKELDASPYGLLDDYPGQTYPIDILPAIAAIQRADKVLGTDHSVSIARASRAFEDTRLDPQTGLPAYIANSRTGVGIGPSRGVGISYMLIWAPELWPNIAQEWYARYDEQYWQDEWFGAGFREFSDESLFPEWYFADVDAGPVIGGFGTAASAFGIGAARTNGRFDQAYPLSVEALVASWPLADGTLLGPRLLSNLSDAPYLGESALLFNLTRTPVAKIIDSSKGTLPFVVYIGISVYAVFGLALLGFAIASIKNWHTKRLARYYFPKSRLQLIGWFILIIAGLIVFSYLNSVVGVILVFLAQFLPRGRAKL
jgi:hypothetical protein